MKAENLQDEEKVPLSLDISDSSAQLRLSAARPHLGVHQRGEGEVVEQVCEVLPHVGVAVFPQALVVEAVHLCDLPALVVPPEDCDALPVADLETGRAQLLVLARPGRGRRDEGGSLAHLESHE